jgi:tetratricopeptide (TPR) repeat protein
MYFRPRRVLASMVSFLVFAALASGQTASPSNPRGSVVKGQVISAETDAPVERVRVELRLVTGDTVQSTYTRHNGEFEFTNVGTANYVLVIEEKGYEPVRESVDLGSAQRQGMTLFLQRPLLAKEDAKGGSVSVHELALPGKTRKTFRKGLEELYKEKNPGESVSYFQRTLSEAPGFYEAHYHLGIAAMQMGQVKEAERELRRCVELIGKDAFSKPYFALASLLSSRNEFVEAEAVAQQGIARDPSPWQGHYELARALLGINRLDEAEKSVMASIQRKSDYAPAFLMLANIHIRKKDYPALIRDLDEFLRLDPNGPMSASARQTREQIQKKLSENAAALPPK